MQRHYIFILILVLLLVQLIPAFATKYTAAFLNNSVGARAAGMGGSFTALGLDATTIHWNPAALGRISEPEIVLMHSNQFNNLLKYDSGHFVWPDIGSGSLGLGYIRLATGDIFFTENLRYYDWGLDNLPGTGDTGEGDGIHNLGERIIYDPGRLKVVNDAEQAFFLSFARQITTRLAMGGNIKYLWQSVGKYSSSGWGFDLGAIYDLTPRLTLGLNVQDVFGTIVHWSTGHSDTRTINVRPGIAYRIDWSSLHSQFNLASDADIRFDNIKQNCDFNVGRASFDLHLGFEYWLYEMVALRIGSEQKSFTAGAGLRISFFAVDYAFSGFELGNTHRISLTLHRPAFGKKEKAPKPPKEQQRQVIEIETQPSRPKVEKQPPQKTKEEERSPEHTKLRVEKDESVVIEKVQILEPILAGTIEFETGKADLKPSFFSALETITNELRKHPHQKIKIVGHTDNRRIRTVEFLNNHALSMKRAEVVMDYLVNKQGIEPNRATAWGVGPTQPIMPNTTAEGRGKNRRVEVFITTERY